MFEKTAGDHREPTRWSLTLLAICLLIASGGAARGQTGSEANQALAVAFLDRYSLGYGLLYACGKSRLPAFMFDYQAPSELTEESAGSVSPQLLKLIIAMQADPLLYARTCDTNGPLADHFAEPELSNELLDGLSWLDPEASGSNAFETGVYFRIRGEDRGFERYADRWHRALEEGELVAR